MEQDVTGGSPAGLGPWQKTKAYRYSAGARVAGCIKGMMWIDREGIIMTSASKTA